MLDSFGTAAQPAPQGDGEDVTELVIRDLQERAVAGERKYGTRLKTHNGRSFAVDKYQELLDAVCYARGELQEKSADGKPSSFKERAAIEFAAVLLAKSPPLDGGEEFDADYDCIARCAVRMADALEAHMDFKPMREPE